MEPDDTQGAPERVPCPDDMCTGVLGADGRCGTCGRVGELPDGVVAGQIAVGEPDGPSGAPDDDAATGPAAADGAPEAPGDDDDDSEADHAAAGGERVPCPDEMCTGVLGADGRCGTCGRAG